MAETYGRIEKFLMINGWDRDIHADGDGKAYLHQSKCSIDIMEDELVLIDDTGDFLYLPKNYYALLGALIDYRQLSVSYVSAGGKDDENGS